MKRTEVALGWKSIAGYRHQIEGRENEDAVIVATDHALFDAFMIVADGMGGHDEPKLAAETAAAAARDYLTRPELVQRYSEADTPRDFLRQAVRYANQRVAALGARGGQQPGSTLTVAAIADGELHVAHAGDGSTMLMRDGRLRPLVGGEERRLGNRPQEYLGRGPNLEIEEAAEPLAVGDRVLICTDGLTRYFGQVMVGGGGLGEVLGRATADPQAIANQLTAHSRTDQYDDDTTVVVAEVVEIRPISAPRASPARAAARDAPPPAEPLWRSAAWVALLAAVVMVGAWFVLARWRPFEAERSGTPVSVSERTPPPAALRGMPKEDLLLIDKTGQRFYVLRARPTPLPADPVDLEAMRSGPDGLLFVGRYRWDPGKGVLKSLSTRKNLPVDFIPNEGALRALGLIEVTTEPAGAKCWIDGKAVGKTPIRRLWHAGRVRVRVRWEDGTEKSQPVIVPSGAGIKLQLGSGS